MDKFDFTRHRMPTPYERELLTILIEEAAEVQQRATKLLRFGATEVQPGQSHTNAQRLTSEIGDMACMVGLLADRGIVDMVAVACSAEVKKEKLRKFMQHEPD